MALTTDSHIRTAQPRSKPYKLPCGNSLSVWINPGGSKTFRYKYYVNRPNDDGELVRVEDSYTIGRYPEVSLKEARKEAQRLRGLLDDGIDPKELKRQQKRENEQKALAPRFRNLVDDWLELSNDSDRHQEKVRRSLEMHALPILGDLRAEEIEYSDIERVLKRLTAQEKYDMAGRVLSRIRSVLDMAQARGDIAQNIASNEFLRKSIAKGRPRVQHFKALDFDDVPSLLEALDDYQLRLMTLPQTALIIRFSLLTFVRPGEARYAEISEFDLKKKQWEIPAEKMKEGRPHIVPLSRQAIGIIREARDLEASGRWLFPGSNPNQPLSENTVNKALNRMGFDKITHHGMRSLVSTELHERGYDHQHIEAQLSHKTGNKVAAAYNHAQYLPQRRKMMQDWADLVMPYG